MSEKWYIIEQFGKVGPFSLQDLLSGVERGDFDYKITIESESTHKRTTLSELVADKKSKKKPRRTKAVNADADATRIVPSSGRRRSEAAGGGEHREAPIKRSSRGRGYSEARSVYVERRRRHAGRRPLLLIPAMLIGGILSLALFYGLQKLMGSGDGEGGRQQVANIVDLPLEPDELTAADSFAGEASLKQDNLLDIRSARMKANQTVFIGPLAFRKAELYRCRVKCKIEFRDKHGAHITGVFFAEAFKNNLLKRSGRVVIKGRVSADGNEVYLQSLSP